jgi:hypothetical protein
MEFLVAPKEFVPALKRLLPHPPRRKLGLRGDPLVMLTAEGAALDLAGQFENVWSIAATVKTRGSCVVDVKTLIEKLKTYDQKVPLAFVLEADGLKFGTTRLKLHAPW